jgi:vanillate O-demethylase ferredoxin subunit
VTDEPLTLDLSLSGLTLDVAVGKTLLDAMEEVGVWVPSDCRRGECHMCMTQVVGGEPIPRDHCLTPAERATTMTPCISWARGGRLTLEL